MKRMIFIRIDTRKKLNPMDNLGDKKKNKAI